MSDTGVKLVSQEPTTLGQIREWLAIADDAGFTDDSEVEVTYKTITVMRPPKGVES